MSSETISLSSILRLSLTIINIVRVTRGQNRKEKMVLVVVQDSYNLNERDHFDSISYRLLFNSVRIIYESFVFVEKEYFYNLIALRII